MVTVANDTELANISGISLDGSEKDLFDLIKAGRYSLVWWHPQALTPTACKTCGGGRTEPIQLMLEIYDAGCDVIGLTYESPEKMSKYFQDIGLEYPILSVDEDAARSHGVAKVEGESWQSIPHRIAFLINDRHEIINRYEVHDPTAFLRTARDDVKAGPPASMWEQPKRKKFLGIF